MVMSSIEENKAGKGESTGTSITEWGGGGVENAVILIAWSGKASLRRF